jgi:hypothetical protein
MKSVSQPIFMPALAIRAAHKSNFRSVSSSHFRMRKFLTICMLALFQHLGSPVFAQALYTQTGTDVTWQYILDNNLIPTNQTSYAGITGSDIDVNQDHTAISSSPYKDRAIQNDIAIHTLGNETVPRADFPKWSRWYQEDVNTQIFRLFKDEINVRNTTWYKPRIEAELKDHTTGSTVNNNAEWAEWSGTYTIVKPVNAEIFQIWGSPDVVLMLHMKSSGEIQYNPRDGSGFRTMVANATGGSFNVRVRDYGNRYEVYLNDVFFAGRNYTRTSGGGHFRWGIYHSGAAVANDCMIFVTGAQRAFKTMGNTAPTLSAIGNRTISGNTNTGPLAFTVSDDSTPAGSITLNKSSSNTNLVPPANIVFGGSGSNRTVTVTPAPGQGGSALIGIIANDGTLSATNSFTLTVNLGNSAPVVSPIADQTIFANTNTGPLAFTLSDDSTAVGSISLNQSSSNTNLVPSANIVFGGSGADRTVTVTPATNQSGSALIRIIASDGSLSSTNSFALTVLPPGAVFVSVTNNTPGTTVWICPPGVTNVKVECWGGGGAGGAASKSATANATGGGGGGGAYARNATVPVTPGSNYLIIIPAAATAPVGGASDLQRFNGSSVFFTGDSGALVAAAGGEGGQSRISAVDGNASGLGGAGGATDDCVGDVGGVFAGGMGGNAASSPSGGGGGGAGDASAGGSGVDGATTAGVGGVSGGGNGGAGRTGAGNGNPGLLAGGGGAGGKAQNAGSSKDGGLGGLGQIVLTYLQVPVERPVLGHNLSGGNLVLTWSGGGFKAQICTNMSSGTWTDVPGGNVSPVNILPSLPAAFYRLTAQ